MQILVKKGKEEDVQGGLVVKFTAAKQGEQKFVQTSFAAQILEVGIGQAAEVTAEAIREATGIAVAFTQKLSLKMSIICDGGEHHIDRGFAIAEALLLATYVYDTYKKPKTQLGDVTLLCADARQVVRIEKGVARAAERNLGITLARNLVNAPPHDIHPEQLAQTARDIAKASKGRVKAKILERVDCEKLGMGAFLAVAQGSAYAPKFIHLTYTPTKPSKSSLAIVGKGITFDSGGLSLKPSASMATMKCDMGGAAAVLGLFSVITTLAPRYTVHGIIAAAENMPSGTAYRPGDIVRSANGKTIEVLDTDAEGRMTLADALDYATKLLPTAIVDLATLTGACIVGLGEEIAGLMCNDEALAVSLLAAAERAGEKLWEMPLEKRYRALLESDVADIRQIATSRYGGSLTAGLFLQEFVGTFPWAHLDIAGPAFAERPMSSYIGKGGTGYGVRTLVEFVQAFK